MAKLFLAVALLALVAVANAAVLIQSLHVMEDCSAPIMSSQVSPMGSSCDPLEGGHVLSFCGESGVMVALNCNHNCSSCDEPAALPAACNPAPSHPGMYASSVCAAEIPADIPDMYKVEAYMADGCTGDAVKIQYVMYACHYNQTGNSSYVAGCHNEMPVYTMCAGDQCSMNSGNGGECTPVDGPAAGECHARPAMDEMPMVYLSVSCTAPEQNSTSTTGESSTSGGSGTTGGSSTGGATATSGGSTTGGSTGGSTTSLTTANVNGAATVMASIALIAMAAVVAL